MSGLMHKKMSEDERNKMFWHIINNQRMFKSLLEISPYYLAWVAAALLLVNVSIIYTLIYLSCRGVMEGQY